MTRHAQQRSQVSSTHVEAPERERETPERVQLKRDVANLQFDEQTKALQPPLPAFVQTYSEHPVQHEGGGDRGTQVRRAAAAGVQGSAGKLPYLDRVQAAFGGHDVSNVQSYTGDKAKSANRAMGSKAYATGNAVAFKGTPDLHTVAHEAAHVVQQRAGVKLSGGVGQAGDSYERHADAVAGAVVRGQSAAPLLDSYVGSKSATQAVQAKSNAADPKLESKRKAFEDTLARYGHGAPESTTAMQVMCQKAWNFIETEAKVTTKNAEEATEKLKKSVKKLGMPLEGDDITRFGGRVGQHFSTLKAVFLTDGNLRERVNLINTWMTYNWAENSIIKQSDAVVKKILDQAKWGEEATEKILQQKQDKLDAGKTSSKNFMQGTSSDNTVMVGKNQGKGKYGKEEFDSKLAPIPLEELESDLLRAYAKMKGIEVKHGHNNKYLIKKLNEMGVTHTPKGEKDPRTWSKEKKTDHSVSSDKAKTAASQKDASKLSHREEKAVSPLGEEFVPSIRGDVANVLNEDHPWIKLCREQSMPMRGGPSGTSERFMNLNTLMATGIPHSHVRLAMLGFFPLQKGHSFHEIMSACAGHGDCKYTPGMYHPVPPVPTDMLMKWGAEEISKAFSQ